ncbi:MAG: cobalamin biosynthesis protein [Caulobacteraceae bacterium]
MVGGEAVIVAGLGFRTACPAEELIALIGQAEQTHGVVVGALAAPDFKTQAPELLRAAKMLGLAVVAVTPAAMVEAQPLCLTRSPAALAVLGVAAVSEACALAAAGVGGRLLGPKRTSASATCALAQGLVS